jgi:hypothetical protein
MQTLKQITKSFANELYSWVYDNDFLEWELDKMKLGYCNELKNYNPEWEEENKTWESWYIKWYEIAIIELMNYFKSINLYDEAMHKKSKIFTSDKLETMLNNLLIN